MALASMGGIQSKPSTRGAINFVLVHGTWHGGWVWHDVAHLLRSQGHHVLTPTCTGCGDRVHLSNPSVGLQTHIADIENSIRWAELDNFVLVGHSFSGLTITGVADRLRGHIKHIVFFDALVPQKGRMSGVVKDPKTGAYPMWWQQRTKHFIDGYKMDLWQDYPIEMLVPKKYKKVQARLKKLITSHPAKQWTDELIIQNGGWEDLPRSFIHCAGQKYKLTSDKMIGPARGAGWNFLALDIPRDGMLTHPQIVANQLHTMTK
jgi:pimeloyl-ACP methyl ester carboxylesterase